MPLCRPSSRGRAADHRDDADATTTLTRSHAYDDYGRLSSTTYPSSATDAVTVGYEYRRGYRWKLNHGTIELVEVTAQTAYGQSRAENYGNGVRTKRDYDKLGRLTDIDTTRRGGAKLQDNTYAWRSDGSLQRRTARAGSSIRREHFEYDYLNRLTSAATRIGGSATASRTLAFGYDLRGNLTTKTSDVSADDDTTNVYPETSNRITSAAIGDVPYEFPHDTSGHIKQYECKDPDKSDEVDPCADIDDTFIDWNARGLAEKVTVGDSKTDTMPAARDSFRYGPDGARYFKKSEWEVTSGTTTTLKTSRKYYASAYEKTVTAGGETVERTRIGDSVVHVRTTSADMMPTTSSVFEYVHRVHLGSVEAVTNEAGEKLVVLAHDPYGERRKNDWTARLTRAEIETLLNAQGERVSRGFTRPVRWRGRHVHRLERPRARREGDGGREQDHRYAGGAGHLPLRPGRGALLQEEQVVSMAISLTTAESARSTLPRQGYLRRREGRLAPTRDGRWPAAARPSRLRRRV